MTQYNLNNPLELKIKQRMDILQGWMEDNYHLRRPEVVLEHIQTVSKFWSILQEEDIDYKERLVSTVTNWISDREAVPGAQVDVLANDRRFRVPDCPAGFTVGYVTTPTLVSNRVSNATVRVNCDETHWTAILRVNIDAQPEILIFTRDLAAGTVVIAQDIAVAGSTKTPAAEDIDEIIRYIYEK